MVDQSVECTDCTEGLEHCHEVLVVHINGSEECTDPGCEGGVDLHDWFMTCMDAQWPCLCSRIGHSQPLAA